MHHPGLVTDGERQLPGEDDRDLLLDVVMRRGRGARLEGDEVRHHGVGGDWPELQARNDGQRVEIADMDEAAGRVGRLADWSK